MTSWRRSGVSGAGLAPQLPTTSSVNPWCTLLSAVGRPGRTKSAWECMSMKPGATARPVASITWPATALGQPLDGPDPVALDGHVGRPGAALRSRRSRCRP